MYIIYISEMGGVGGGVSGAVTIIINHHNMTMNDNENIYCQNYTDRGINHTRS